MQWTNRFIYDVAQPACVGHSTPFITCTNLRNTMPLIPAPTTAGDSGIILGLTARAWLLLLNNNMQSNLLIATTAGGCGLSWKAHHETP